MSRAVKKRNKSKYVSSRYSIGQGIGGLAYWLVDLASVALAGYLAYFVRFQHLTMPNNYQLLIAVGFLVSVFIFSSANFRHSVRSTLSFEFILSILRGAGALAFVLILFLFVTKTSAHYSRIWLVTWFCLVPMVMIGIRLLGVSLAKVLPMRFTPSVKVTLIGRGQSIARVIEGLQDDGEDLQVENIWLTDDFSKEPTQHWPVQPRTFSATLDREAKGGEIWICMPMSDGAMLETVLGALAGSVANIRLIPDMTDFLLVNYSVSDVCGMPAFSLTTSPMQGIAPLIKSLEDKSLALLFILLSSPLMLLVALGVKLASPGPVLYRQERVGWNGKTFYILKFRSMPVDLEVSGVQWGKSDQKVQGRFSKFIRATSLDELPQLFNVFFGDMSLVGPRPERPEFVEQFKHEIPGYMQKHLVKAGITGWAQLHGWRGDTDLKKRIEFDLYYVENWSLWMDLRIIFQTVLAIALRKL